MLICTKKAAELTGLSAYELRHGFKQVGRGSRRKSLRWDPEILQQAIRDAMCTRKAVGDQDDFVFRR